MPRRGENITKRKDGRWEARIIKGYTCEGKALYTYIYGKSYAEAKQKKLNYIVDREAIVQCNKNILFSAVLADFLLYQQNRVKDSTYARYKNIVDLHIVPFLGDYKINELTSHQIEIFSKEKLVNGRIDGKGSLSPKRVRDILSILKLAISYAQDQGYIEKSIKFSLPKVKSQQIEILSKEEEIKLMGFIINNLDTSKIGVIISLCTGMRIGELCALKWSDIDLESNIININKTLQRLPDYNSTKKTKIVISEPKSKSSERQIPIPEILLDILFKTKQTKNLIDDYVLTSNMHYIEPSNYYVKYQHWLQECGIPSRSFHALRHTFATRAVESGMDIKSLSEILGHSDVKITLSRYVHPSLEMKHNNMNKYNVYICSQLNSQN